jgi:hypothetical protein
MGRTTSMKKRMKINGSKVSGGLNGTATTVGAPRS